MFISDALVARLALALAWDKVQAGPKNLAMAIAVATVFLSLATFVLSAGDLFASVAFDMILVPYRPRAPTM